MQGHLKENLEGEPLLGTLFRGAEKGGLSTTLYRLILLCQKFSFHEQLCTTASVSEVSFFSVSRDNALIIVVVVVSVYLLAVILLFPT